MPKKPSDSTTPKVVTIKPLDISIVKMFANGNTVYEISEVVGKSDRTIEHRMERLKKAVGARNTTHLVYILIQQGILKGEKKQEKKSF